MSKKKGKQRFDFDTSHVSEYEFDIEQEPASSAASVASAGFDFKITSKPMSKKAAAKAAEEAAKAAEEAAKKEAAEAAKRRQKLFAMFPQLAPKPVLPTPRPSVTCETCGAPKPEGAVGWRESTLGFSSKGICPACFRQANAHRSAPKLVWVDQPDTLSVWRDNLVKKSSETTNSPNDMLKARLQGLSTLRPVSLDAREKLLMQSMRELTMKKLKQDKKGGTRRKSKSKSKSRRKST